MKDRTFLPALQIFRALAALMVVFHHLWHGISFFFSLHSGALDFIAASAKRGVDFFFVLSGFIICYANFGKIGGWQASGQYLGNRFLRIFVPYLPISLLMLLCFHFLPSLSDATNNVSLLKSLFLLPVPGDPALSAAWTLVYEMFFYVIFVSFFLSKRLFYVILTIWVLLIGLTDVGIWTTNSFFLTFLFSPYNLEFILGVCTAFFVNKVPPIRRKWVIAGLSVGIVLLFLSPVILDNKALLGLLFVLFILLAVDSPLNRISDRNILLILGNASYSIYLIHDPEISLAMRAFPHIGNFIYVTAVFVLIVGAVCVSGVIYSGIFERRLMKNVKDFIKRIRLSYGKDQDPSLSGNRRLRRSGTVKV